MNLVICFLLSATVIAANKYAEFRLEVKQEEISKFPALTETYHLEAQLSSGNLTRFDVVEKFLGLDLAFLEKYEGLEISEGIKEQNELLDLMESIEAISVDADLETAIENSFKELDSLEALDLETARVNATIELESKLGDVDKRSHQSFEFTDGMHGVVDALKRFVSGLPHRYESLLRQIGSVDPDEIYSLSRMAMDFLLHARTRARELYDLFETAGFLDPINGAKFAERVLGLIDGADRNIKWMEELKGLVPKLETAIAKMKTLESLRDSAEFENFHAELIQDFGSFQGYPSKRSNHPEVPRLAGNLKNWQWKQAHFVKGSKRFDEALKLRRSKIPEGNLTLGLEAFKVCLEKVKTYLDFSSERLDFESVKSKMEDVEKSHSKFLGAVETMMKFTDTNLTNVDISKFTRHMNDRGYDRYRDRILEYLPALEYTSEFTQDMLDLLEVSPDNKTTNFEKLLLPWAKALQDVEASKIASHIAPLNKKLMEIETFIHWYSTLKSENAEIQSEILNLMSVVKEPIGLNPLEMESTVDMIGVFEGAHLMLKELKFEERDGFSLDEEGVQQVSEGVRIHGQILRIQKRWNIVKDVDLVGSLRESMEEFPSFFKNPLPSFDLSLYNGVMKMEIQKFQEDMEKFQKEYAPEKLRRMDERIEEVKKWMNPEEETEDKSWADCYESSCDVIPNLP